MGKFNKYRIVTDSYLGYEVQIKRWWFPFYIEIECNTSVSITDAKKLIETHIKYGDLYVVYEE